MANLIVLILAIIIGITFLVIFIFQPIVILVDIAKNQYLSSTKKALWTISIFITGHLASVPYGVFICDIKRHRILSAICGMIILLAFGSLWFVMPQVKQQLVQDLNEVDRVLFYEVKNPELTLENKNSMRAQMASLKQSIPEASTFSMEIANSKKLVDELKDITSDKKITPEEFHGWMIKAKESVSQR